MFLNGCINTEATKRVKIPYYATRMISKLMDATWIFADAKSKSSVNPESEVEEVDGECRQSDNDERNYDDMIRIMMEKKGFTSGN